MTERIVDLLELIEIDEQQRRHLLGAVRARQEMADFVAEIDPVRQSRQFVVTCQMRDPGFRIAPLGDVLEQNDGAAVGHRLERPRQCAATRHVGIGRDDALCLRVLDLGKDHVGIRFRDRPGIDASRKDAGGARTQMLQIGRQVHHLAEAMVHDRQVPVAGEHAEAVRHVVQRGIETRGERCFPHARSQSVDEDLVEAEIDVLQSDEEQRKQQPEPAIVSVAVQDQPQRQRRTGEHNVTLDDPGAGVVAAGARGRVSDGDGGTQHVRDGIVAAEHHDKAPQAKRTRIEVGQILVAVLPPGSALGRQRRNVAFQFVFAHLHRARDTDDRNPDRARPDHLVAGLQRRHDRDDGRAQRAGQRRGEILK